MSGREDKKENDLFYLCSLIEFIARKTRNNPKRIVEKLGKKWLERIYDLADVYHSDLIEDVSDDLILSCKIEPGHFDNVSSCMYSVPSCWDIGKVYKRLILSIAAQDHIDVLSALSQFFSSEMVDAIENYNSDIYYQNNSTLMNMYLEGVQASI